MKRRTPAAPAHRPSSPSQLVQVEKPLYGGDFLARVEGKAVFVPLTLPGEQARIRIVNEKRSYATAEPVEIVTPAAQRVAPTCRHFGVCGGCQYQHANYSVQLEIKQAVLRETLERGGVRAPEKIDTISAEPWAYRNRIRVAFDSHGNPGYRGRRSHAIVPIAECPIAAPLPVRATLAASDVLKELRLLLRLTEISFFCNGDETAMLASAFTAESSAKGFEIFCTALAERIPEIKGLELVAESPNNEPERIVAQWGGDSLTYRAAGYDFRVGHGAFFQVNRWLIDSLVDRVTRGLSGELAWDLFAGIGLFTRRLASQFTRVVAVESAPAAIAALKENLSDKNADVVKAETVQFLRRVAKNDQPDLIVVDPPRTGLGAETTDLLASIGAPKLVYVSCDPATLARDLRTLTDKEYAVDDIALIDLFPQTFHLETVVRLRRER